MCRRAAVAEMLPCFWEACNIMFGGGLCPIFGAFGCMMGMSGKEIGDREKKRGSL
jgi:hypothetical protein